ncbi:hypothetical protein CBM2634_B160075 [Cupriavidus taiwanensis]|uniref:Uncharacterized protein n=1 Tax=Cupriavidus taiwanensis TaxID=164546 RepID=A0A375J5U1_9BURK|nr:hypothetical protein CBM2634_B160075 [Cupriavidus taiwanensis]
MHAVGPGSSFYRHVLDPSYRCKRGDVAVLDQRHAEHAVFVTIRYRLRHKEVNHVQTIADASVRARRLDALQAALPTGREARGLRPDALRVITVCLVKARTFADGCINRIRLVDGIERVDVSLRGHREYRRGIGDGSKD